MDQRKRIKFKKPLGEVLMSDSVTSRVDIEGSVFESYVRDKGENGPVTFSVKRYRMPRFRCSSGLNKRVFHFVFSGWKISDGITEQIREIISRQTEGFNIVKVFLVVGVNDIR
jgi:hypothetical protein